MTPIRKLKEIAADHLMNLIEILKEELPREQQTDVEVIVTVGLMMEACFYLLKQEIPEDKLYEALEATLTSIKENVKALNESERSYHA